MEQALRVDGSWPRPITLTRGWCRAQARPWNDDSPQAYLRLERGGVGFLRQATQALVDLGAPGVLSPALHSSSTRVWRRSGYRPAHRLQVMERSLTALNATPSRTILTAVEAPWDRIIAVDNAAFAPFWRLGGYGLQEALASTQRSALLMAKEDEEIAGYAIVGSQLGSSHLQRIAVHPRHSGMGIGTDLVRSALHWARPAATSILLNVQPENEVARRLYRSEGFRDTGTFLHILRYQP